MTKKVDNPPWFKCINCLFYRRYSLICVYLPAPVEKYAEAYCSQWTCHRCWTRWDITLREGPLIDHSQCKPKFEVEEDLHIRLDSGH